jgi:hypothetical protein
MGPVLSVGRPSLKGRQFVVNALGDHLGRMPSVQIFGSGSLRWHAHAPSRKISAMCQTRNLALGSRAMISDPLAQIRDRIPRECSKERSGAVRHRLMIPPPQEQTERHRSTRTNRLRGMPLQHGRQRRAINHKGNETIMSPPAHKNAAISMRSSRSKLSPSMGRGTSPSHGHYYAIPVPVPTKSLGLTPPPPP